MDALEALRTRRSIRKFSTAPVLREELETIVDCGRLAATAINIQPWEFVVVTDAKARRLLAQTTEHGAFIADAGACIIVLSKDTMYYVEDGSAATQNMLVAAHSLGLGACWVAGDKKAYATRILDLIGAPQDCKLVSLIAVGHPESTSSPEKRSLASVLHWERF